MVVLLSHIKLKCFISVAASKVKCAILGDFEEKLETWEKLETPFHLPLPELDSELLWPASKNLVTSSFLVVVVCLFEDTSVRSKSETCCWVARLFTPASFKICKMATTKGSIVVWFGKPASISIRIINACSRQYVKIRQI